MQEIHIDERHANQRLDKFLKKYFKNANSGFIYKMLRKKNITLNDKKDTGNTIITAGDVIKTYFSDDTFNSMRGLDDSKRLYEYYKSLNRQIDVIYEDDDIIAVNKPAGILSQKSKDSDISINELIIAYLINERSYSLDEFRIFKPSVSNRLDFNTTGVLLAAKTLKGQQSLSKALKDRTIDKYYICIVTGVVDEAFVLEGSLTKEHDTNKAIVSDDNTNDDYIKTELTPIAHSDKTSLLRIHLVTGKTHQIRAHMAHIGHPIIGDVKYGLEDVNTAYKAKYGVKSQMLHSYETFYRDIKIIAPIPSIINRIIEEEYGNMELQRS